MIRVILITGLIACSVFKLKSQDVKIHDKNLLLNQLDELLITKKDPEGYKVDPERLNGKMLLVAFSGDPLDQNLNFFRRTLTSVQNKVEGVEVIQISDFKGKGVESRAHWVNSLSDYDLKHIQLLDNDNKELFSAVEAFGVTEYPTSFLFDAQGGLLRKFTGNTIDSVMNIFRSCTKLSLSSSHQQELLQINQSFQEFSKFEQETELENKLEILKSLELDNDYQIQLRDKMNSILALDYAKEGKRSDMAQVLQKIKHAPTKWEAISHIAAILKANNNYQEGIGILKTTLDEVLLHADGDQLKLEYLIDYCKLAQRFVQLATVEENGADFIKYLEPIFATARFFPNDPHTVELNEEGKKIITVSPDLEDLLTFNYALALLQAGRTDEIAPVLASYLHAEPQIKKRSQEVFRKFAYVTSLSEKLDSILVTGYESNYQKLYKIMLRPDLNGKVHGLHGIKGKYIMLDYWASWCGPCRESHPFLKEMYAIYNVKGLEIVGIAAEHSKNHNMRIFTSRRAVKEDGTPWIQLLEEQENVEQFYPYHASGGSLVKKIIFDKTGKLYGIFEGKDKGGMKDKLEELMP